MTVEGCYSSEGSSSNLKKVQSGKKKNQCHSIPLTNSFYISVLGQLSLFDLFVLEQSLRCGDYGTKWDPDNEVQTEPWKLFFKGLTLSWILTGGWTSKVGMRWKLVPKTSRFKKDVTIIHEKANKTDGGQGPYISQERRNVDTFIDCIVHTQ